MGRIIFGFAVIGSSPASNQAIDDMFPTAFVMSSPSSPTYTVSPWLIWLILHGAGVGVGVGEDPIVRSSDVEPPLKKYAVSEAWFPLI